MYVYIFIYFPSVTSNFITLNEKSYISVNFTTICVFLTLITVKGSQPIRVRSEALEPRYLKPCLESSA